MRASRIFGFTWFYFQIIIALKKDKFRIIILMNWSILREWPVCRVPHHLLEYKDSNAIHLNYHLPNNHLPQYFLPAPFFRERTFTKKPFTLTVSKLFEKFWISSKSNNKIQFLHVFHEKNSSTPSQDMFFISFH